MTDILDQIDAVTADLCACGCATPLPTGGLSAWFAGPDCQQRWHASRTDDPHTVMDARDAMPGYGVTAARWTPPEVLEAQAARAAEARRERAERAVARQLIRSNQTTTLNVTDVQDALRRAQAGLLEAWRQMAPTFRMIAEGLAHLHVECARYQERQSEGPSDPMERALWLRRNRNTGPKQQQWAPRSLGIGRR
jgi:hypothetical protein